VFSITAVFSILAYVWLLIVLSASSPNEVEVWEALITLILFPLMVVVAYMEDTNMIRRRCFRGRGIPISNETITAIMDVKTHVD
jgi:hypothetical protein